MVSYRVQYWVGPLLFLLYIDDLCNLCNYSNPILFADDSNLFYIGDDTTLMEYQINDE